MSKIELVANILTIASAIVLGGVILQQHYADDITANTAFKLGDSLADLPLDFSRAHRTLVVAVRSNCVYCNNSAPFYSRIIDERNRRKADVRIVFVATKEDQGITEHLTSLGVNPDEVVSVEEWDSRIRGTPTLFVADKEKHAIKIATGQVPSQYEKDIIAALFGDE